MALGNSAGTRRVSGVFCLDGQRMMLVGSVTAGTGVETFAGPVPQGAPVRI
jgi:hypothetical protein